MDNIKTDVNYEDRLEDHTNNNIMHSWIWNRLEDFLMNWTQSHIVILVVYKRADSDTGDHIKYSTTHQLTFSAHTSVAQHFRRWYLLHQFFRRIRSHLVLHIRRRQETYNNVALVYRKKTISFLKTKDFLNTITMRGFTCHFNLCELQIFKLYKLWILPCENHFE